MKRFSLLILCLAAVLMLSSCQGGTPGGTSKGAGDEASKAFEKFVSSLKSDDYKGAWDLLSKEAQEDFKDDGQLSYAKFEKEMKQEFSSDPKKKEALNTIVPVEVEITARIKVKMTHDGKEETETVNMVKEDGKWKIKAL